MGTTVQESVKEIEMALIHIWKFMGTLFCDIISSRVCLIVDRARIYDDERKGKSPW